VPASIPAAKANRGQATLNFNLKKTVFSKSTLETKYFERDEERFLE